jgi:integrase
LVSERIGRPWHRNSFALVWRKIARAAGIADNIQNRDSRPGAATEADVAGAPQEKIQRGLGHSRGETTRIYLREEVEVSRELARLRTKKRKP